MKTVCAWCGKLISQTSVETACQDKVSHGMCADCAEFFCTNVPGPLRDFLNRIKTPILLVDAQGCVVTANEAAEQALGKGPESIEGFKGGQVMECAYARLPGGCGNTEHCTACTIRNTVFDTQQTGETQEEIVAFQDILTPDGERRMRFLISTTKAGDKVILEIKEMQEA